MRFDQIRNRHYTDLAVVLGPTVRYVEDDYEDLQAERPEVLLGYRVKLAVPGEMLWGYEIAKLVILDHPNWRPSFYRAVEEAAYRVNSHPYGRIETWHVHRVRGIWRVA